MNRHRYRFRAPKLSALTGAASVLDLSGFIEVDHDMPRCRRNWEDAQALERDYRIVASDFRVAFNREIERFKP